MKRLKKPSYWLPVAFTAGAGASFLSLWLEYPVKKKASQARVPKINDAVASHSSKSSTNPRSPDGSFAVRPSSATAANSTFQSQITVPSSHQDGQ